MTTDSKKRPRAEISSPDSNDLFCYRSDQLIKGLDVHCKYFDPRDSSEIELALMDHKPWAVILYEPHLDFMRSLEVYGAADPETTTRVHLLMNEESVEFYQYMSLVDDEKLGFAKLIESKEVRSYRIATFRDSLWS